MSLRPSQVAVAGYGSKGRQGETAGQRRLTGRFPPALYLNHRSRQPPDRASAMFTVSLFFIAAQEKFFLTSFKISSIM